MKVNLKRTCEILSFSPFTGRVTEEDEDELDILSRSLDETRRQPLMSMSNFLVL